MNLQSLIGLFLDQYQKATTRRTYAKSLNDLAAHIGPARPVTEIDNVELLRYHNWLKQRNYAAATLRQRVQSIKTFFNWLEKMELIEKNPGKVMKNRRLPKRQSRDKAMTDEELNLILDYMQYHNRRDYALVLFLADTGCRIGGAAKLKVEHIDWGKREATVTEKGDKTRQVRFGKSTSLELRKWILYRGVTAGPYVFSPNGQRIKPETLSQRIRRACYALRKVGKEIRVLSAHSLRHRKGFQFADNRIAATYAATALGHESVHTTLGHYYPDDWETAAEMLDELSLNREPDLRKIT